MTSTKDFSFRSVNSPFNNSTLMNGSSLDEIAIHDDELSSQDDNSEDDERSDEDDNEYDDDDEYDDDNDNDDDNEYDDDNDNDDLLNEHLLEEQSNTNHSEQDNISFVGKTFEEEYFNDEENPIEKKRRYITDNPNQGYKARLMWIVFVFIILFTLSLLAAFLKKGDSTSRTKTMAPAISSPTAPTSSITTLSPTVGQNGTASLEDLPSPGPSTSLKGGLQSPTVSPSIFESTTPAPLSTSTPLPAETTPAPLSMSTPLPVQTTPVPVSTSTPLPVGTTPAPLSMSTPSPIETTPAPLSTSTSSPVETTPAPLSTSTSSPVESTPAPLSSSTSSPVQNTPAPLSMLTPLPLQNTPAPLSTSTPLPVQNTPAPLNNLASLEPSDAGTISAPTSNTPAPLNNLVLSEPPTASTGKCSLLFTISY